MTKPEDLTFTDDDTEETLLYPELEDERDEAEDMKMAIMLSGVVALSGVAALLL